MKLSVIVPCFNEAANIPLILKRFEESINRSGIELILVDNGSTDNSQSVLAELLPNYSFARVVKVEHNQGYGFGILSGLKAAEGEFLCWTHADMQTDPGDVIKALYLVENAATPEKTFVKGTRKGRPLRDNIFSLGMGLFNSIYLGAFLTEINAQPNLFHRSFFNSFVAPPYDFSLDLYAYYLARRQKLTIIRFPVLFPERIHGHSHWNIDFASKWKLIKRTLKFSVKLKRELQ